jgi:dienelactone hydrolase
MDRLMRIRSPRWLALAVVAVAAVLTGVLVVVLHRSGSSGSPAAGRVETRTIAGTGGVELSAMSYVPSGTGRFPLIVMPGSWGSHASEYQYVAAGFQALGFAVVSYAQRGFGGSGGLIDLAGPATVSDVSRVIDWALAHLPVDEGAVGLLGASYGGGVSLLAAEHDARVKAVVSFSGWTDLAQALAPGNTPSKQSYASLFRPLPASAFSPEVRALVADLAAGKAAAADGSYRALSATRSAIAEVAALGRHGTAVMLGDTYEDSLLPPAAVVPFFDALTAPKRLELAAGDPSGSALAGLQCHKSALWQNAGRWMGHYLRGDHNSITGADPVQLQDVATGQVHGYRSWQAAGKDTAFSLGDPARGNPARGDPAYGGTVGTSAAAWTYPVAAGVATAADAGPEQYSTGTAYRQPTLSLPVSAPDGAAIWSAPAAPASVTVNGIAQVRLALRTSASAVSLFGYLYDVGTGGSGRLMTHGAITVAGTARAATIALQPISWTLAPGHQLALVVDTVDARYFGQSVPGSTVTLASPATLTVPVG